MEDHISGAAVTSVPGCCAVIMDGEIQTKALAVSLRYEMAEKSLPEKSGDLTSGLLFTSNPRQVTDLPGPKFSHSMQLAWQSDSYRHRYSYTCLRNRHASTLLKKKPFP